MSDIISFYQRFSADIKANKKTITIRNSAEANYQVGQVVDAITFPEGIPITRLRILQIQPITLDDLTDTHAAQENMPLSELVPLIGQIYPEEKQFFVIEFEQVISNGE